MSAQSFDLRRIGCLLALCLPLVAGASICATPAGRYAFERNLSILNTGPVTCAGIDVASYETTLADSVQTGTGGPTVASGMVDGVVAGAFTTLGSNHAVFVDNEQRVGGLRGRASSVWTDVITVTGPVGAAVTLSFSGHLDGRLSRYDGSDKLSGATLYYGLQIGTTEFAVRGNSVILYSDLSRDDSLPTLVSSFSREPFLPGGDLAFSIPFQVDIPLYFYDATPLRFGMMGNLLVSGAKGDVADLGNTASLDRIAFASTDGSPLANGISINAHGVALQQDAQGRFLYASVAAAVPEAPTGLLLLAGLGTLALTRARWRGQGRH